LEAKVPLVHVVSLLPKGSLREHSMISGPKIKKQNFGPQGVLEGLFLSKTGINK